MIRRESGLETERKSVYLVPKYLKASFIMSFNSMMDFVSFGFYKGIKIFF